MKGGCVPLVGDTPRIGVKGRIGSEESLEKMPRGKFGIRY
jgi:hypothetical protein